MFSNAYYGCNMGMGSRPDVSIRCPSAADSRTEGGHIKQTMNAHALQTHGLIFYHEPR